MIFMRGRVLGGDTGFTYTGTYQTDERNVAALVKVRNFLPDVANVLGVRGDFELNLKGVVEGQVIKASASLVGQQGAGIVVKMTKVSDLPT